MTTGNLQLEPELTVLQPLNAPEIPPLEHGAYLTRREFERRYHAMPEVKKAELIEGRVSMPSPVRHKNHGEPHSLLVTALGVYRALTPGVSISDNATVRLGADEQNEPQPDVLLMIDEAAGGQAWVSEDGYIEGAPELIAEIAASTVAYDLDDKKEAYRRNGVQEYLVWQTDAQRLDWFWLVNGRYAPLPPDADGIVRSRVFPGLWLAVAALLRDEMTTVLAVLQQGLAAPEHADFVARLAVSQAIR